MMMENALKRITFKLTHNSNIKKIIFDILDASKKERLNVLQFIKKHDGRN